MARPLRRDRHGPMRSGAPATILDVTRIVENDDAPHILHRDGPRKA
jgi:hypothetical protein